jgi:hypothetical protein
MYCSFNPSRRIFAPTNLNSESRIPYESPSLQSISSNSRSNVSDISTRWRRQKSHYSRLFAVLNCNGKPGTADQGSEQRGRNSSVYTTFSVSLRCGIL